MDAIINVVYMREGELYGATSSLEFLFVVEIQILSFLRERVKMGIFGFFSSTFGPS